MGSDSYRPVDDNPGWLQQAFDHYEHGQLDGRRLRRMAVEWLRHIEPYGMHRTPQAYSSEDWLMELRRCVADVGESRPGVRLNPVLREWPRSVADNLRRAGCVPSGEAKYQLSRQLNGISEQAARLSLDAYTASREESSEENAALVTMGLRRLGKDVEQILDRNAGNPGLLFRCGAGYWSPPADGTTNPDPDVDLLAAAHSLPELLEEILPLGEPLLALNDTVEADRAARRAIADRLHSKLILLRLRTAALSRGARVLAVQYPVT